MTKLINFFKSHKLLGTLALFVLGTGTALAVGGTAINPIYEEIVTFAQGDLGAIATALVVIFAGVQVYNQNYLQALGAVIFAVVFSNLETIVGDFFTATVPLAHVASEKALELSEALPCCP